MMLVSRSVVEKLDVTLCASSKATILPPMRRPSINNDRQIENKAQASFSLTKGQLKSIIVRDPFSNCQISVVSGFAGAPGLGSVSMNASKSCNLNFSGPACSLLKPAPASLDLKSLYFKPGAPRFSIAMSRRTLNRT
jgi:hypothetical protein